MFHHIVGDTEMKMLASFRFIAVASLLFGGLSAVSVNAQDANPSYTPLVGQEGKDVVWVPTAQALVDRMLDMAKVTSKDYLVDLGSGDGRTVITAAKRGIKSLGIEYNPDLVLLSRKNAEAEKVGELGKFTEGDIFLSDFSTATVVTMFLLPDLNIRLRPTLLRMAPGTRLVSNSFHMGDWSPDQTVEAGDGSCTNYCKAFLWIVPAKVEGEWKLPQGRLNLKQQYQMISGELTLNGTTLAITEGRMDGDQISITFAGGSLGGRVTSSGMEFTRVSGSAPSGLVAIR
jgi:hypothetical protein